MILILDLCYSDGSLSGDEFVGPVAGIVRQAGAPFVVRHYTAVDARDLASADGVILCGTALLDNLFSEHLELFGWLPGFQMPVLGICAGMQVITALFGGSIEPRAEIGMTDIQVLEQDRLFSDRETFQAYELHSNTVCIPDDLVALAVSERCIQAIRHRSRPIYGVMFHPEVRNEWVVTRFLEMC